MEGLGLGFGLSKELDIRKEVMNGTGLPKLTGKAFLWMYEVNSALDNIDDEGLDKVIADCRAGEWSKELPGKPWYFGLLSKKKKNKKFLYLIEFAAAMKKYERQAYENILNNSEIMGKIRDTIFKINKT